MRDSSLATRLARYTDLTGDERDALDWMERREVSLPAGAVLVEEGADSDVLFVVQAGWLHSSVRLKRGGRQILRFHFPGDMMGTSGLPWLPAVHTLTAVSACTVSELSRANLARLFREQPRLGGLLFAMSAAENVALCDRLTSAARQSAMERVGMLLLDVLARLRVTEVGVVRSFDLPLTQADLGDAVGLTKVHVNRTLARLEEEGYIARAGRRITVADEARLVELTGFVDRYASIDTEWLAPAVQRPINQDNASLAHG